MKKQPTDTHPADQFMQALDAKIQPVMNETQWEGMQALLDENFPPENEPGGGVAQSDSKPETGAGKAVKSFRWIILGAVALIATLAGTQWNAMAFQNSDVKQEKNIQLNNNGLEENSTGGLGGANMKTDERKSKPGTGSEANTGINNLSNHEPASEEFNSNMNQFNSTPEQIGQNQSDENVKEGAEMVLDSVPGKKQQEPVNDTTSIKKKKFIFW